MAFELCKRIHTTSWQPFVSLSGTGQCYISKKAMDAYRFKDCKCVKIFFDKELKKFGFLKSKTEDATTYRLFHQTTGMGCLSIGATLTKFEVLCPQKRIFLDCEKIGTETLYTFKPEMEAETKVFLISLDK